MEEKVDELNNTIIGNKIEVLEDMRENCKITC